MDVLQPFLLEFDLTPDHSNSDIAAEWEAKSHAQSTLSKFLRGEVTVEQYDDALSDIGIDPYLYWEVVGSNIDHVIQEEMAVENIDFLLVDHNGRPLTENQLAAA